MWKLIRNFQQKRMSGMIQNQERMMSMIRMTKKIMTRNGNNGGM